MKPLFHTPLILSLVQFNCQKKTDMRMGFQREMEDQLRGWLPQKDWWIETRGPKTVEGSFLKDDFTSKKGGGGENFGREELSKGGHDWIIRRTRREGVKDDLWFEEGTVILKATWE